MDPPSSVLFRNVGLHYFPHTRVECHYRLSSEHQWSSKDWVGLFQVGWSSIKSYYTYTWAEVPEGYIEGTDVDSSALFYPFFLPRPSAVEYQFVYVDGDGRVCARSSAFTFSAPKPLEELETVKEEHGEEEGEEGDAEKEELLLVIPRAQLLQMKLDKCWRKQEDLQRELLEARQEAEHEKVKGEKAKSEWECERASLKEELSELRQSCEQLQRERGKEQDVRHTEEHLTAALRELKAVKAESEVQITELQEERRALTERDTHYGIQLERLQDRLKKVSNQMKHDEEKRKSLQADRDRALMEVRGLQERLEASDHVTECLRRELRELGARQSHMHAELHQARMHGAQLTLQLSEEQLQLREERAHWALEREAFKQAAEVANKKLQDMSSELERKEEWLQEERMERQRLEDGRKVKVFSAPQDVMSSSYPPKSPLFCIKRWKVSEGPSTASSGSPVDNQDVSSSFCPRSVAAHLYLDRASSCVDAHTQSEEHTQ